MTAIEIPTPDPRTFDDVARPFAEAIRAHYAIKRVIGRGGMGVVYLARDRRLDRLVAIKTLLPELAVDDVVRKRFLLESRTAAGLAHPNIVPVHGADEIDGHAFYSMSFVDGESLAAHIRAREKLPANEVVRILRDVATGLAHAHRRGIVHRDIKAENILIERATGSAVVTDFGIARVVTAAPLTATGQVLGTVHYASPEQVTGEAVDARSDLYSLGVVAYLALTGRFPFDADVASAVLVAHVTKPVPSLAASLPGLPPSLVALVERCLAKDPDDRFESADALVAALSSTPPSGSATGPSHSALASSTGAATIVSTTEAHALWQRAADLQAATGMEPRPLIVPRERDRDKDRSRNKAAGNGYRIEEVRSAASEAGIDARYVDHALAEHGLVPAKVAATAVATMRSPFWAGVPLDIVKETTVPGEIDPRDFERFINVLRDSTGTLGTTMAQSRELAWRAKWFGHRLDASIVPNRGVTTIRLSQSIRRLAAATMAGGVVGGAVIIPLVAELMYNVLRMPAIFDSLELSRHAASDTAVTVAIATSLAVIPLARRLLARFRRKSDAELSALATLLADKARAHVEG